MGCEDNPSEPTGCDIELNGVWNYTTIDLIYSEECICYGQICENSSTDNSCRFLLIEDKNVTFNECECDESDPEDCLDTNANTFDCEGSIISTEIDCGENCESSISIIDESTISLTIINDGVNLGLNEGCFVSFVQTIIKN